MKESSPSQSTDKNIKFVNNNLQIKTWFDNLIKDLD